MNVVKPGVVDMSKIVMRPVNTFQVNQNLQLGIQGCKEIGVVVVNIGAEDIREMKVLISSPLLLSSPPPLPFPTELASTFSDD